jgi:hypothetical protein
MKVDHTPYFDATLKTKYEYAIDNQLGRFTVRNSRLGLFGNLTSSVSYKTQIEFSSEGKFDVLDMYANIKLFKGFELSLGQTSIPIFNPYTTTPSLMLFANRTFLAKFYAGTRDIGIMTNYSFDISEIPILLQFGVFNGSTINNPVWTKKPSYSARVVAGSMNGLRASAKVYRYPLGEEEDYLIMGADLRYGLDRFKIETEVMNRHNYFSGVNRFSSYLQGAYSFPINGFTLFKDITPAIRWDGIGEDFANNAFDVNRFTFGLSFGLTSKPFSSLLRLDYEHYIVDKPIAEFSVSDEIDSDKFTVELLIIF